jgi:hypothetical protein
MKCSIALALFVAAGPAAASPRASWGLEVEAFTEFPSLVAGGLRVLTPGRFEVSASAGWLPGGYTDVIGGALTAIDAVTEPQADAITGALQDSLVLRTAVAWRPWRAHGFWVETGYALLTMGGDATGRDLLVLGTGADPGSMPADVDGDFDVSITAHRLHFGTGWRWALPAGWSVRAGLGADVTLAASSSVEARFEPRDPFMVRAFEGTAERGLDALVTEYVHNPTLIVDLAYRFF